MAISGFDKYMYIYIFFYIYIYFFLSQRWQKIIVAWMICFLNADTAGNKLIKKIHKLHVGM